MKNNGIFISLTFLILLITELMDPALQEMAGIFLILSIGLFHGAHDIFLLKKMKKKNFSWFKIGGRYLLIAVSFGVLYFILPFLLLILFIMFSAYHFGEQHWLTQVKHYGPLEIFFAFSYGLVVIILLLLLNFSEAQRIIQELVSYNMSRTLLGTLLVFCSFSVVLSGFSLQKRGVSLRKRMFRELIILGLLAVLFARSSIIWGFAVYFVFWHSIPSIITQIDFMYGKITSEKVLKYFQKSLVYWIISLAGLAVLFVLVKDQKEMLLSIIIPFLAVLTFPHALVISRMLWKKNRSFKS